MYNKVRKYMNKRILLPVLLLSPLLNGGLKITMDFDREPVSAIVTCAGAAAGAFGAYKLYSWLSYKDARKLAKDALSSMEICKSQCGPAIDILNRAFTREEQRSRGAHKEVKEPVLFALIEYIELGSLYAISSSINELANCRYRLEKKRNNFLKGFDQDATFEKAYIESLLVEMDVLLASMQFLNAFVKEHRGYFDNISLGKKLSLKDYSREIAIINANFYDQVYQLNCCARSKFNAKDYSLMAYTAHVKADLANLSNTQRSLAYNYPHLINSARTLEAQLRRIIEVVETSQDYAQEKLMKREEELKMERLRIEKQKADAEDRKANAKEREARAKEQQAAAEWAKLLQPLQPPV